MTENHPNQTPLDGRRYCDNCPLRLLSDHRFNEIEKTQSEHTKEIKELQFLAAQVKLLMSLSIGGGLLSIVAIIKEFIQ